jgi:predicted nucleic acid-binding Zn ribbon protein
MQRASRLLGDLKLPDQTYCAEELARAAWQAAVGKKIAAHAHAARMVRTSLIVEVEDDVWRMQLYGLRAQILSNLARHIGRGHVEDLEFRVVPPRRGPQRAATSAGGAVAVDEADTIADPGLRRIYRMERTKAGA